MGLLSVTHCRSENWIVIVSHSGLSRSVPRYNLHNAVIYQTLSNECLGSNVNVIIDIWLFRCGKDLPSFLLKLSFGEFSPFSKILIRSIPNFIGLEGNLFHFYSIASHLTIWICSHASTFIVIISELLSDHSKLILQSTLNCIKKIVSEMNSWITLFKYFLNSSLSFLFI